MYKYYVYRIDREGIHLNEPQGLGAAANQRDAVKLFGYNKGIREILNYKATLVLHSPCEPYELDMPNDDWDYWLYNRAGEHIKAFGVLKEWLP
jgi:hypothetical protein